jgi:hypothetical protein
VKEDSMELTREEVDRYCSLSAKIEQKAREIVNTLGERFLAANEKFDDGTGYVLVTHNPIAVIAKPLFLKTSDELKEINWKLADEKRKEEAEAREEREKNEKAKRYQEYLRLKKEFDIP